MDVCVRVDACARVCMHVSLFRIEISIRIRYVQGGRNERRRGKRERLKERHTDREKQADRQTYREGGGRERENGHR